MRDACPCQCVPRIPFDSQPVVLQCTGDGAGLELRPLVAATQIQLVRFRVAGLARVDCRSDRWRQPLPDLLRNGDTQLPLQAEQVGQLPVEGCRPDLLAVAYADEA